MSAEDHLGDQFEYRGQHQTIFEGDVTAAGAHEMDRVYPDYYERPELYHHRMNPNHPGYGPAEAENARETNLYHNQTQQAIMRVRGRPEAPIDMYRAVPRHVTQINQGDWVTPSEQYARIHAEGNLGSAGGHILHARAKARQLRTNGDYAPEFGYAGPSVDAKIVE